MSTIDIKGQLNSQNEIAIDKDGLYTATYLLTGQENIVINCKFVFQKPYTKSKIIIRAVIYDSATFNFEGMLKIKNGANQVDSYLKIDCLLLGNNASARAVPSLEINEDNVKAGHGATIGTVDYKQLNYLMEKGVSKNDATDLLVNAFLGIN